MDKADGVLLTVMQGSRELCFTMSFRDKVQLEVQGLAELVLSECKERLTPARSRGTSLFAYFLQGESKFEKKILWYLVLPLHLCEVRLYIILNLIKSEN